MGKIEKLLDKTKRNGETKKWKMYVFAVVGILVVVGGFFGVIYLADIDDYISSTKQSINLYYFYDSQVGNANGSIYFLGSSIVGYSIYPPEINKILHERGYDFTAYNLFLNSESPLEMALQTQKIIDANPSLVVIGVIPRNFNYTSWVEERVVLVHNQLKYDSNFLNILSDNEKNHLETNPDIMYKKKYFESSLKYHILPEDISDGNSEVHYTNDYSYDPIGITYRQYLENRRSNTASIDKSAEGAQDWHPVFTSETNQQKEAFLYITEKLRENNISTLIISIPQYPVHVALITPESRDNYHEFLNSTLTHWVDLESWGDKDSFMDDCHFTYTAALKFAPLMADLIIKELT